DRLIICAHSLGAVVSRIALLEAGSRTPPSPWLKRIRLVLFAPAHLGASIIPLVSVALSAVTIGPLSGQLIEPMLKARFAVLIDLEPSSRTLKLLEQRTKTALGAKYRTNVHLRANVIHGGRDIVVDQNTFVGDFGLIRFPGKTHTQVCKPELGFIDPLTTLLRFI
ncbi:MAG: hypothetical protein AB1762_20670, partial [Gemmatimonadota bacterium]